MADAPESLPGKGLLGWLGRQVGYVKKAVRSDVGAPPPEKVVYRHESVREQPHPRDPQLHLRRTTIDEAVRRNQPAPPDEPGKGDESGKGDEPGKGDD